MSHTAARLRFVAAWALTGAGIALAIAAASVSPSPPGGRLAIFASVALIASGFVAAAASQVVSRADRRPEAYRGPSPVVLLVASVAVASLVVGIAGNASGLLDLETPAGVLFSLTVGTAVYAVLVLGLVVRPGALSWADMGWPRRDPPADPGSASAAPTRYVRDVAIAMGVVAPTYIGSAFLGGLLAMALGVTLTSPLPAPSSSMETVATILGALFLAPIGEELFFRGFALTAWWRDLGARAALVRTTLLFAVVHVLNVSSSTPDEFLRMAILQVVVILPVGYVLGRLAISRGMVAAIAGHATFNGIALFLLLAVGRA